MDRDQTLADPALISRYTKVCSDIDVLAERFGRAPEEIRLVAVSKTHPVESVATLFRHGQIAFGESYAQELGEKATSLPGPEWHFIGRIQSNKLGILAKHAAWVHSIDREDHARVLDKKLEVREATYGQGTRVKVLVLVNFGLETSKEAGADPAHVEGLCDTIRKLPRLELRGLMTVPPPDREVTKRVFESLAALRERLGGKAALPDLSMGMSGDLDLAIETGSTLVRIGSSIFGQRANKA